MRSVALVIVLAACGPKVNVDPNPFDKDDPAAGTPAPDERLVTWDQRPEAPKGPGVRTGTIDRTALLAVLDAGPGVFLRQFEVTSAMDGDRFVGWQLVQLLDQASTLNTLDLTTGDILVALNGAPLSRPDQLMTVWDSLRTANRVTCDLLRGDDRFQLDFAVEPPAGRVPPDLAPPTTIAPTPAPTPAPPTPTVPAKIK